MRLLIYLLRFFTAAFGTTEAKPHEEEKYAIFLGILLLAMTAFVIAAMVFVWHVIR